MRGAHNVGAVNLDLLRSFFAVVEHGSLNQAAERLRVSQSTLTRQMHALEDEVGGRLLERSKSGVALTAAGYALHDGAKPALAAIDAVIEETRKVARGKSARLRIGYVASAASQYLHPALATLRRAQPQVKVMLSDLSPGQQLDALRKGEIDLALIGGPAPFSSREFFVRRLASLPVFVALADNHPLASEASIRVADLRRELFVGAPEYDLPGHDRWLGQIGRRAGFRLSRIIASESLTHALANVVSDGAVAIVPEYVKKAAVPGVVFRPLRDAKATWDLAVVWQRGKISAPVRALLDALPAAAAG